MTASRTIKTEIQDRTGKQMRGCMTVFRLAAFVGLLFAGAVVASAQTTLSPSEQQLVNCAVGTPAEKIATCTTRLNMPNRTPSQREADYVSRGEGYRDSGQYALAMQDFAQALKLIPGDPFAIDARGKTYDLMGQYDQAIADFTAVLAASPDEFGLKPRSDDVLLSRAQSYISEAKYDLALADCAQALVVNPGYVSAYATQGSANFAMQNWFLARGAFATIVGVNARSTTGQFGLGYTDYMLGNYAAAEQELQTASDLSPTYAYPLLWLHLARMRQGKDDSADFAQRAAKLSATAWPAPVVKYFLGQMNDMEVITASMNPDGMKNSGQLCETQFYIGEDQLLHKNLTQARSDLNFIVGICPKRFVEYGAAVGELARMGPVPGTATK